MLYNNCVLIIQLRTGKVKEQSFFKFWKVDQDLCIEKNTLAETGGAVTVAEPRELKFKKEHR